MTKFESLAGQRFGKLLVIERAPNLGKHTAWLCKCDCGEFKVVPAYRLKSGQTASCGCANRIEVQIEAGRRYGMLEAICLVPQPKTRKRHWLCRCDCGNLKYIPEYCLQTGQSSSCGCQKPILVSIANTKHGEADSRLFHVWTSMKQRCSNPNRAEYRNYGARGISVCEEWSHDYTAFRDWALSTGYDESAPRGKCTLDRIDVNGNYEPDNCRWVDAIVQAENRRPYKQKPTRIHPVIKIEESGHETRYESIIDAARALGDERKRSLIGSCCRGLRPTAYGYKWRYA